MHVRAKEKRRKEEEIDVDDETEKLILIHRRMKERTEGKIISFFQK
jgi:hypothetical protein